MADAREDDGRGCAPQHDRQGRHHGARSIAQRAATINATDDTATVRIRRGSIQCVREARTTRRSRSPLGRMNASTVTLFGMSCATEIDGDPTSNNSVIPSSLLVILSEAKDLLFRRPKADPSSLRSSG